MAFTTTPIYTTQTLTSEAEISTIFSKADLNDFEFNGITIEAKITNGSKAPIQGRVVKISYVFSSSDFDIEAVNVSDILRYSAYEMQVPVRNEPSGISCAISIPVPVTARYMYTWVTHDTLGNDVTLDASYIGYNFGTSGAILLEEN